MVSAVFSTLITAPPLSAQQVTGEQVNAAVERAKRWLLAEQRADGRWADYGMPGGTTALATLALLNAGVPADNAQLERAIRVVRGLELDRTYVVSLKIQALAAADPVRHRDRIQEAANWLVRAQLRNNMWGYGLGGERADFSNSQFAMLGLHEATKAGVQIPPTTWNRARRALVNGQNRDGGWGYIPSASFPNPSTGSMTAACLASLYICGNELTEQHKPGRDASGRLICCQPYVEFRPIARGLAWLATHFNPARNAPFGHWYYYYMYAIERVGILSGVRYFGHHDWYREGAAALLARQKGTGSWEETHSVVDTSFALLFLAKGHRPVVFHKLQWTTSDRWNLTRNDLAHLVTFIGDALGEPVSWEVVPLDADVAEWIRAPILYFNGHEFPRLTDEEVEKLREYIRQGGTILISATCQLDKFRKGFEEFAAKAFPDYPVTRLDNEHPVFHALHEVDAQEIELQGISVGCRTSIFFSPNDIACMWDLADVPIESERAFKLGANIAAYATGLEPLPDKLAAVQMVAPGESPVATAPARGAVHLAQLMHNGDWRPNPKAIPHLAAYLHESMGIDVVPSYEPLLATDPRLAQHPIVYLTGHYSFELTPEQTAALRQHLERGGFLFANACCGRQPFDTSFRKLAAELFPDHKLEKLPPTHPILIGEPGVPIKAIEYRPAVRAEQPNLNEPQLEGIDLDGRTVVVYSRFSIDCGLDGHKCFACRGIEPHDALRIAGNVILYALSY